MTVCVFVRVLFVSSSIAQLKFLKTRNFHLWYAWLFLYPIITCVWPSMPHAHAQGCVVLLFRSFLHGIQLFEPIFMFFFFFFFFLQSQYSVCGCEEFVSSCCQLHSSALREQSMNHISLKGRPRCCAKLPTARNAFQTIPDLISMC